MGGRVQLFNSNLSHSDDKNGHFPAKACFSKKPTFVPTISLQPAAPVAPSSLPSWRHACQHVERRAGKKGWEQRGMGMAALSHIQKRNLHQERFENRLLKGRKVARNGNQEGRTLHNSITFTGYHMPERQRDWCNG
ncbi:unnamed protein product [Lepidochelys olivacea]